MKPMLIALAVTIGLLSASEPAVAAAFYEEDGLEAVMRLVGAQTPEDVTEEDFERFSHYLLHPVPINMLAADRLVSCGLMTAYQAASLADYRNRHGDVLSVTELALVDGFSPEAAAALAPFVSFVSDALPGNSSYGRDYVHNEAVARGGGKRSGTSDTYSYGMKYRLTTGKGYDAGMSLSRGHSDKVHWPGARSFFFSYNGRGHLSRIVVGDYNLRYGQGLALWTGFSMSGTGTPASVFRRPSGLSPYWSWSGEGSRRGVAADMRFGAVSVSASVAAEGLRELINGYRDAAIGLSPSVNVGWLWKNLQVSFTWTATTADLRSMTGDNPYCGDVAGCFEDMKTAADFAWNIRGTDVFGEVAYDIVGNAPAAVFGSRFRCGEALVLAAVARYYPVAYSGKDAGAVRSGSRCSNEHGASLTGEFGIGRRVSLKEQEGFGSSVQKHTGSFSIDAAFFPGKKAGMPPKSGQMKVSLNYKVHVSPSVALEFRIAERLRTWSDVRFRTDARADVEYLNGDWRGCLRANALYGSSMALLTYMEGGYKNDVFSVYFRAGAFKVDDWDDRIYVYERDAPGSFNVPACYGRGYWLSMAAGVKFARLFRAYLRFSHTSYPWMPPESPKPPKAELKLQLVMAL